MSGSNHDEFVLQNRLFAVLQSPEVDRINFTLGSIKVDGPGLREVVVSLMLGAVHIAIKAMRAGAAAEYDTDGNTFLFPNGAFGAKDSDNAVLVHESVHAMQDIDFGYDFSRGDYFTLESENEAAAYVAGALYDIYKNINRNYVAATPWGVAHVIADKIKDTPGASVSDADAANLRAVIAADPTYRSKNFAFDSTYSNGAGK
jgi:hypothetical protein